MGWVSEKVRLGADFNSCHAKIESFVVKVVGDQDFDPTSPA
jgi:hypothetical protein